MIVHLRQQIVFISVAIGIVELVTACTTKERTARERFAKDQGCPIGSVSATEHPELSAYDLTFGDDSKPPDDIAKEPERVALWKASREERRTRNDTNTTVFLVAGCQKKIYYGCSRSNAKQGSNVGCSPLNASVP
jgi:hypothetical protein